MCPVGKSGTPIKGSKRQIDPTGFVTIMCNIGRPELERAYELIKENGGVVISYDDDWTHIEIFSTYDDKSDATLAYHELSHMTRQRHIRDSEADEVKEWESGAVDARFVREYDLS